MNIIEFNNEFKRRMKEVKMQERIDSAKAKKMWLSLVKFLILFGKSDDCPPHLKRKIGIQAEKVLNRVKKYDRGEISSVFSASKSKKRPTTSISSSPKEKPTQRPSEEDEEDMLEKLQSLPDVPNDGEPTMKMSGDVLKSKSTSKDENDIDGHPSLIGSSPSSTSTSYKKSADLKGDIQEIDPVPFDNKTIIPKSSSEEIDLEMYKKDTVTLDITNEILNNLDLITSDEPEKFSKEEVIDPGIEEADLKSKTGKICFACGADIAKNQNSCPQCGAENSE